MILSSCSANCCDFGTVFPLSPLVTLSWHLLTGPEHSGVCSTWQIPTLWNHSSRNPLRKSSKMIFFRIIKAKEGHFSVLSWAWICGLKYKHHLTPALGVYFHRYFLKCCMYLAEFEILNIPFTYESFHKSPKEGMIKGLWKNHSHEPRVGFLNPL